MPTEERVMRAREVLAESMNAGATVDELHDRFEIPVCLIIPAMLAFADEGSGIGERGHFSAAGFEIELGNGDVDICWPDGRWINVTNSGKITVGKSPFDPAFPPIQTTFAALSQSS